MDLAQTYSGKRVLVTGDTGFKGSWLAIWLLHQGAEVIGLALPPASPRDNFVTCELAGRITHVDADVREYGQVAEVFERYRPEMVFHLAAQSLVRESYRSPRETFATNVMGTVNVLDAARHTESVRVVVVVTSDKCYENQDWTRGYRETDVIGGKDPYSASKGAAELITASMRRSFFDGRAAVGTARAGNVIGGGDWAVDRIVPDCIRALVAGEPITVRNPSSVRPWQHVLDALHGYLHLGARLWVDGTAFASGWNFGPAEHAAVPVQQLVEDLIARWGSGTYQIQPDGRQLEEARFLYLDITKARDQLGWRPVLEHEHSVALTIEGYRADRGDPGALFAHRIAQIRDFEERARA